MIFCISCHVILQFHIILQHLNELKSSLVEDKAIFYLNNEGYVCWWPGPRLNIKTVFPRYGDSHVKDKTVGETVLSLTWESLYW